MSCVVCSTSTSHVCGACLKIAYCSTSCQSSHWKSIHKSECIGRKTYENSEEGDNNSRQRQVEQVLLQFQKDTYLLETQLKKANEANDFTKRNNIQQKLYDATMETLEDVLQIHGASKAQVRNVKTHLKTAEQLIVDFQGSTMREQQVKSDAVEQISRHQKDALKAMEEICDLPATTQQQMDADEKRAFQELHFEIVQYSATLYMESLEWIRAQVLAKRAELPPEIIEEDVWSAFYDYMKEASYGATQDVLRRLVQCLGWGSTYSSYMRSNIDREKIHAETKALFDALRQKSPGGSFELADRLLFVADKLDGELTQMRSARLSQEERGQVYARQTWIMEWMAGMAMTGALGYYWCNGVKSKEQAELEWNSTIKNQRDTYNRLNATSKEALDAYTKAQKAIDNFKAALDSNKTQLMQIMSNNEFVLRNPHDSFRQIADAWVDTQGQPMKLASSTKRVLVEANNLFKRISADRNSSSTGAGADAVGFFNPLPESIISEETSLIMEQIPPDLMSIHNSFFKEAKKISATMMEQELYRGKDFPSISGPRGQSEFFREKEAKDWREIEDRVVRDLKNALDSAEIKTEEQKAYWMKASLSNIAAYKPGLAQKAAEAFVKANAEAKKDLEAAMSASQPILAQMSLELKHADDNQKEAASKLTEVQQLIYLNSMEGKKEEYLRRYPGSPMSLATSVFLTNPWTLFKSTFNSSNNTAGQEFNGTFYPIMESSWSQLMYLKREMLEGWANSVTWWGAIDGMAKFTSMAFTMAFIFNFFTTLTGGTASVALAVFLALFIKNRAQSLENTSFDESYVRPHLRPHHSSDSAQAVKTGCIRFFFGKTGSVLGFLWNSISMASTTIMITSMMSALISDFLRAINLFTTWAQASWGSAELYNVAYRKSSWITALAAGVLGSSAMGVPEFVFVFGSALVHGVIGIPLMARVLPEKWWIDTKCWHKALTSTVFISKNLDLNWKWQVVYVGSFLAGYWVIKKFFEYVDDWVPIYSVAKWFVKLGAKIPLAILPKREEEQGEEVAPARQFKRSTRPRSKSRSRK